MPPGLYYDEEGNEVTDPSLWGTDNVNWGIKGGAQRMSGYRDLALVATARPADPARADLSALGDVAAELADVLVIDLVDLRLAEEARLPATARERSEPLRAASCG